VNLDSFTSGLACVNIGGYSSPVVGYSINLPWIRSEANIDVVNNWTKIFGRHTLKFRFAVNPIKMMLRSLCSKSSAELRVG
jgi:hypothetical protein